MASSNKSALSNFERPPVVEVIASVQFEPLEIPTAWMGQWWSQIRDRLPHVEDKPPIDPRIESFGSPEPPRVQFKVLNQPPIPQVWFSDEPRGAELLGATDVSGRAIS